MTKRWKILLTAIILTLLICSLFGTARNSKLLILTPSDNIQHILNYIESNTTIILTPGEYHQPFTIKKQINLIGLDTRATFINVTTEQNKPAITISTSNVYIKNLTIQNNAHGLYSTGIRVLKNNVTIESCVFQNTPIGISIWSNNNSIKNCSFMNCQDEGIVLLSTSFSTANNNVISSCFFQYNCDAIELQQSCHNIIQDCIIIDNTHSGIDAIDKNNDNNIINNCTIINNKVHGIYFSYSKENKISNCSVKYNKNGNIVTPYSTNITILKPKTEGIPINENKSIILYHEHENPIQEKLPADQFEPTQRGRFLLSSIIQIIKRIIKITK